MVSALPSNSKVILQMPRGNLECIQPRSLSLSFISSCLKAKLYHEAFDFMMRQRINLNLIFDYDPTLFIENIDKFVNDIGKPDRLALFMSELNETDVTTTIYTSSFPANEARWSKENNAETYTLREQKLEIVCRRLLEILNGRSDAGLWIQPILICLVRKEKTENLEDAFAKIKELKNSEKEGKKLQTSAVEALKYLLYHTNINVLYDTALGKILYIIDSKL